MTHIFHFLKKMQKLNVNECKSFLGANFSSAQMGVGSIHLSFVSSTSEDLGVTLMCPFSVQMDEVTEVGNGENPQTISLLYKFLGKSISGFKQNRNFSLLIDFENLGCLKVDRRNDGFESYLVNVAGDAGWIAVF